jgi:two-component system sensor histidine kinase DegS
VVNSKLRRDEILDLIVQAGEDERRRISLELHDTVTQWMIGALNRVRVCDVLLSEARLDEAKSEIDHIESVLKKGVEELRRVAAHLRSSPSDDLGFEPSLRQGLEELQEEMNINCYFQKKGELWLSSSMEIPLYRIIQEALNNIRRHSNATAVSVQILSQPEGIFLAVHDNGKGFDLSRVMGNAGRGLGLLGMRERAEMLGGALKIRANPGRGTRITLSIPTTMPQKPEA